MVKLKLTSKGQSLIEVIMVILLVSVFLVAFANLAVSMVSKLTFAKQQLTAKSLLDKDLEDARFDRDTSSWGEFAVSPCGSPTTAGDFDVERVCTVFANYVEITSTVSWPGRGGTIHAVSAATILSNETLW